jgi:colanic acid biosynthesis glycosyl transferase WcaI
MRILLLTTYFRPDVAANGIIMGALADEFVARGHHVTVVTTVPHYDINQIWPDYRGSLQFVESSKSMQVYRLYTYVAQDKANVFQRLLAYGSFSLLSTLRCLTLPAHDVGLVPSPPLSNGVIADLVARLRGTPFVYNVQDIWPDVAVRAGVLKNQRIIQSLKKMERFVYRRAAGVTVISESFRKNLLEKGVPEEKISIIPNFTDISFITPQPKRNPFSIRQNIADKFVVLYAGNMGISQGLETVLDAANLLKGFEEIEFLMIGNGAGRDRAQSYLSGLGLRNVCFLPYQPREDLPAIYGSADVCLVPLRRGFTSESTPSKLLTIMAAGRPAIAAVDPGSETWQLLQETQCGLCVKPEDPRSLADAIIHYFHNNSQREKAGQNARRCAEVKFRAGAVAEQYLQVMSRAIGLDRGSNEITGGKVERGHKH